MPFNGGKSRSFSITKFIQNLVGFLKKILLCIEPRASDSSQSPCHEAKLPELTSHTTQGDHAGIQEQVKAMRPTLKAFYCLVILSMGRQAKLGKSGKIPGKLLQVA